MDYLAAMRAFVRSVELGSFSKAAAEDNQKVSTVSRYVSALEADLGAALLNRSTRRLHLTEVGTAFYERAVIVLAGVEDARLAATSLNASPQGLLRINAPGAFGRLHIVPHLKDFRNSYPQVRLDITLTDVTVDLIDTGTDVAVRIGALADSTLIAKRLAPQRRLLVCTPGYLAKHGTLETPHDLIRHECLIFTSQPSDTWYFSKLGDRAEETHDIKVSGAFRTNDSEALLIAVRADMGIALLPSWLLKDDIIAGRVICLLPTFTWSIARGHERAIWGVYPPKKTVSPKVKSFLAFLTERFGNPPYWDR
ncbi:MAG: LysR family transcriptional regulator [Acidocella sp.]|nr:LysR family transcriptional regulator [Acidocella sp.]